MMIALASASAASTAGEGTASSTPENVDVLDRRGAAQADHELLQPDPLTGALNPRADRLV